MVKNGQKLVKNGPKCMCGCECCFFAKSIHSSLISWRDSYLKNLKYQIKNSQNRRSSEKAHHTYEIYINTFMPNGRHIYAKAYSMEQSAMCAYTQSDHALPHCKCVFRCCAECPCINLPDQETENHNSDTTPSIRFHIDHIIGHCTAHSRISLKDKKICHMCKQESSSDESTKIYIRKELVMMETIIFGFHTSFYIPSMQKLAFQLPHVRILGKNYCGKMRHTAFKGRELF